MDGEKAAEEGAAEEGAVRAGAAGGGGTGGGATIAGRSGSWTRGAGVPRGMVRGSSGDGDGGRTGTGGLRGGRFRRGAGLDKLSSSSRLISVGREGARWASAVTAGMGLLSRLGGGGGTWSADPRVGRGPEPSSAPRKTGGRGGGGGGGGGGRRGKAVLSEPASGAEDAYGGGGGRMPGCDSAPRTPLVTRMTKSPTKTLSAVPSDVASVIFRPFT